MTELPPEFVTFATDMLGEHPISPVRPAEHLGVHSVLRYAVADDAETYRRIMRVVALEHQAFGLRLRPEQIAGRVARRYGISLDAELLDQRLAKLYEWGALGREHDASLARTVTEWRRNRYTFDVTPAGRLTEGLLRQLDELGQEHAVLDGERLPAICGHLGRLAEELSEAEPDGGRLRELLEHLLGQVGALHEGALAFMASLGGLVRGVEHVDEEEFERTKGALVEHLQAFRTKRRRWASEILTALERIDGERLISLIVAAEKFVELPRGAPAASQRARRHDELTDRWRGVRVWFVGEDEGDSPWRALNDQIVDAIRAVLDVAQRLVERRTQRVDRARAYVNLAERIATAPQEERTAWLRAAFGLLQPRHVGVPEADGEQVVDAGRTPWAEAPPAPVVAYLRQPGAGTPGRGRGAPIRDVADDRRRLLERRRQERTELDELLRRFAARGTVRISDLGRMDEREFAHLRAWISRAYELPARNGIRSATSSDGRVEVRLVEAAHGERTTLVTPIGRLETPDFRIEVRGR